MFVFNTRSDFYLRQSHFCCTCSHSPGCLCRKRDDAQDMASLQSESSCIPRSGKGLHMFADECRTSNLSQIYEQDSARNPRAPLPTVRSPNRCINTDEVIGGCVKCFWGPGHPPEDLGFATHHLPLSFGFRVRHLLLGFVLFGGMGVWGPV